MATTLRTCVARLPAIVVGLSLLAACRGKSTAGEPDEASTPGHDLPVILLTGFEPFGPERPPNPSWEGVKSLDGSVWRGHRIACRQLRVVWGEPLRKLPEWIDELQPVAVFSFGQGAGFTIETLARNARAPIPDNQGQMPPATPIVASGPPRLATSIDAKAIQASLRRLGSEASLSDQAGSYLCEEALYALEFLRSTQAAPRDVAFCHVPPLGARLPQGAVTPEFVSQFVMNFLAAWHDTRAPAETARASTAVLGQPTPSESNNPPQEAEVRQLIDRYFRSWSNKDLLRYGQCFMPQAAIQLIDPAGRLTTMPLAPFLKSQDEAHRQAGHDLIETPESVVIRFDAKLAHALVHWKLVDGQRVEYGYDHFTLMRHEGAWRIVNLVFYASPAETNR